MGSAFAAKVSGASSGQYRSLGATRRHAAIARSVPPEAAYRGPTRSVDRVRLRGDGGHDRFEAAYHQRLQELAGASLFCDHNGG